MNSFLQKLIASLDTHSKGFSARKLAAFTVIILVVILHIKWFNSNHWEYTEGILVADYGFIALCLGMTTYEAIKKRQTEPTNENPQP
jgi:hypothetical protein